MIERTLYGVVRKTSDDGHEFALREELSVMLESAEEKAKTARLGHCAYDKANRPVRVAKFLLQEVEQ